MPRRERFPDELRLRKLNARNWQVVSPYRFHSRIIGTVTVPAGTVTDLASIPFFARCFVATDGEWTKPAVVHDFLYGPNARPAVSRRYADRAFHEAMTERGVSPILRTVIYLAVRLGGWVAFKGGQEVGVPAE